MLLANVGTSFASLLLSVLELLWPGELFAEGFENNPVTLVLAFLTLGLVIIQVVLYFATVVLFLMWLYRTHENLAAFGVPKHQLQYSSGWAVGSFFVPFVSLIIPYRAIRELWRKSVPQQTIMFGPLDPPGFFPVWWGFWIASNIIDQASFRLSWREDIPSDAGAILGMIGGILGIIAGLLAIKVVSEIQRQQVESSKLVPNQPVIGPPPEPPDFNQPGNFGLPQVNNS